MGLTASQEYALAQIEDGENVFLTGEAGTGKSYVIKEFMKATDKNVLLCAPTGIAAIQIGGETLHRAFGIPVHPLGPDEKTYPSEVIKNTDVLIIDEISMVRFDVFSYVSRTLLKLKKQVQLIVVGDFFQLPPVVTAKDSEILKKLWDGKLLFGFSGGFAFEANEWNIWNFKTVWLTEILRQEDEAYVGLLNHVRMGNRLALNYFNAYCSTNGISDKGIYLCGLNKTATELNDSKLNALEGKAKIYKGVTLGNFGDKPAPEELQLKVGARVMSLLNSHDKSEPYKNGSLGTVVALESNAVIVQFDEFEKQSLIGENEWLNIEYTVVKDGKGKKKLSTKTIGTYRQIPLRIAYAITIHKSQGQTFNDVNLDPYSFTHGQLYVALSRCRRLKDLHLTRLIQENWLIIDKSVQDFYSLIIARERQNGGIV